MDLIMPEKGGEVTVKIVSSPYIVGNDVYCNVQMWGNPQGWTYRMKFGKTLWYSIYEHLSALENDPFNILMDSDSAFKIDEGLEYLNGKVITIRGVTDMSMSFKTKEGKTEFGKKFIVEFKGDLEDAERLGVDSEIYKKALFDTVLNNLMCVECIVANSDLAKFEIEKKKEKEKEKELKKKEKEITNEEKRKKKFEKSEVEWVKKRLENDKKNDEKMKKLGDCAGW